MDFGPLNLSMVYRYCTFLEDLLKVRRLHIPSPLHNGKADSFRNRSQSPDHEGKQIVHYASSEPKKRSCSATLIGAYCIIYRGMTPEEA